MVMSQKRHPGAHCQAVRRLSLEQAWARTARHRVVSGRHPVGPDALNPSSPTEEVRDFHSGSGQRQPRSGRRRGGSMRRQSRLVPWRRPNPVQLELRRPGGGEAVHRRPRRLDLRVLTDNRGRSYFEPVWSPNGRQVAFVAAGRHVAPHRAHAAGWAGAAPRHFFLVTRRPSGLGASPLGGSVRSAGYGADSKSTLWTKSATLRFAWKAELEAAASDCLKRALHSDRVSTTRFGSGGRVVCANRLNVSGVDPTLPTARPCTRINGTRPVRRSPIARSISSTVSCTSSSSPSMKSITDSICPATTLTLYGGKRLSDSHFSSSRN